MQSQRSHGAPIAFSLFISFFVAPIECDLYCCSQFYLLVGIWWLVPMHCTAAPVRGARYTFIRISIACLVSSCGFQFLFFHQFCSFALPLFIYVTIAYWILNCATAINLLTAMLRRHLLRVAHCASDGMQSNVILPIQNLMSFAFTQWSPHSTDNTKGKI